MSMTSILLALTRYKLSAPGQRAARAASDSVERCLHPCTKQLRLIGHRMLVTWLRPSACAHCAAKGVIIRLTTNYSHHVYCMRMERTRKRSCTAPSIAARNSLSLVDAGYRE
jgi:hypothetical protein